MMMTPFGTAAFVTIATIMMPAIVAVEAGTAIVAMLVASVIATAVVALRVRAGAHAE